MSFGLQWQALLLLLVTGTVLAQRQNCVSSPNIGLSSIYDAIPNFQSGTFLPMQAHPDLRVVQNPSDITDTTYP
jgi:hypothetical protein